MKNMCKVVTASRRTCIRLAQVKLYYSSCTRIDVHLQYHHAPEYNELAFLSSKSTKSNKLTKLSIKESFGKLQPLSRSYPR